MIYDNVVIGSSISALGCILGLLESNQKVLCIDGSTNISELSKNENKDTDILFCKQGLPLRKFSGNKMNTKFFDPFDVLESKSFGGLSNIWGANSLRLLKNDFNEWPINYDSLEKYYEKCEEIMNISHFNDEISTELGISKNITNKDKLNLFSDFIKNFFNKKKQSNNHFIYGYARVGLDLQCYKCSSCFFGCKDNYIFSTKDYLKKLINEKKIDYKNNLILKKFTNKDNCLELEFENSNSEKIYGKKLFIGTGSIQTPKIVINSLNNKKDLKLSESQPFFIPCIYTGKSFKNNLEHHTLSQAQIIFKNNKINELGNIYYEIKYDQKLINLVLRKKLGFLSKFIPTFLKRRLFVITGFINSKDSTYSGKIKKENLEIEIIENQINKKKIKIAISKQLGILEKNFNFISLRYLIKLGEFGRGFHLGGSIPMLKKNNDKEKTDFLHTNVKGEISHFKNVFIIDSSNFANIPAGSISLTIMANALRIAMENSND